MALDTLNTTLNSITDNPTSSALVGGGLILGTAAAITAVAVARHKKKKKAKYKKSKRPKYSRRRKHGKRYRKRYTPHTAGKRKDTSHKRIRYTKHGQPYVILSNGRARFIKQSSATRSHRQKGGRY